MLSLNKAVILENYRWRYLLHYDTGILLYNEDNNEDGGDNKIEEALTKTKFLVTLSKTRNQCKSDKQFKKIMQKMEQGKNLKKKI